MPRRSHREKNAKRFHVPGFVDRRCIFAFVEQQVPAAHIATFAIHEHNYGIIHADLHRGNVIFQNNEPYPIDFGRCGFGYHLYDITQAIMGLHPPQRAFFIEGYSVVRKLEDDAVSKLESFLVIAIIEAYSFYAESASDMEMLIEDQPFAQAILKSYLEGEPFLLF